LPFSIVEGGRYALPTLRGKKPGDPERAMFPEEKRKLRQLAISDLLLAASTQA